jgi:hypothetical protein
MLTTLLKRTTSRITDRKIEIDYMRDIRSIRRTIHISYVHGERFIRPYSRGKWSAAIALYVLFQKPRHTT